jgi:nicotinamide-nucleotide amidase
MNSAVLIPVGDELLNGSVIDTNSAWIAAKLFELGILVKQKICVGDQIDDLIDAISRASHIADLIIVTGGLGPTKDDVTKKALCIWSGSELKRDAESFLRIQNYMKERGREVNPLNMAQADVPAACAVLPNLNGTAPGMWFEKEAKVLISLPGVPYEMKAIMESFVLNEIRSRFARTIVLEEILLITGLPESELALKLESFESELPDTIQIAYLPEPGIVKLKLRMVSSPSDQASDKVLLLSYLDKAANLVGTSVFGRNLDTLESVVLDLLRKSGKTLSIAESCTGGNVGSMLVNQSGASDVFAGGVISYSNEMKIKILGVKEDVLNAHGAVSQAVACDMARGVRNLCQTDYGLSITGIAGPGGGSTDKPVGTVWIGIADHMSVQAFLCRFESNRARNIRRASLEALNILRKKHLGFLGQSL